LDFPKELPTDQVGNYVWWVYRFCIDTEGVQKASNRDRWLRRDPQRDRYRFPVTDEIHKFPDDHPQSWKLDPWGLGPYGTRLNLEEILVAKRRQSCPALTNDPPLIYRFPTFYKAEVILQDPEPVQDMEVDAPPIAIPSSSAGSGGVVTAPSGNIYLDPDDMQGVDEADRTDDLPPEEQQHDDQDVEMGQASTAGDQIDDAPPTATFRRDPNLPRGEARQKLLKEIIRATRVGNSMSTSCLRRMHETNKLFIRFAREKLMSTLFLDQAVSGMTVMSTGLHLPWTLLDEFAQKSLPGTKPGHRTSRFLLKKKDFVAETIRSNLLGSIMI
jgi:hypothetical protein